MKQLVNISDLSYDSDKCFAGDAAGNLPPFLRRNHLDGLELMICGEYDPTGYPPEYIHGVHLRFWPTWYCFYLGEREKAALRLPAGTRLTDYYEAETAEGWVELWRHNIRQAVKAGAKYVVFHVAECAAVEIFHRRHAIGSEAVITAAANLINEITAELPESIAFLAENIWWPGLNFTDPALARELLDRLSHKNSGFCLDTGHLMCTDWSLRTQEQGIDYVCRRMEALGELAGRVKTVHLHQSLSGKYAARMAEAADDIIPDMRQAMEYIGHIDNHLPITTPYVKKLFDFISPDCLVHEFMPSDMADWEEKLKIQQHHIISLVTLSYGEGGPRSGG
ncbi:MAG: TIM barrel protein [Selenomonadaceae bacterium]|nr:TIM barrel protein [Selenomonadaceae bacterium]